MRNKHDYYSFEPPTITENLSIADRYMKLEKDVSGIRKYSDKLENAEKNYRSGEIEYKKLYMTCKSCVFRIMEDSERLDYLYDPLSEKAWFYDFQQAVAALYWRLEEDYYSEEKYADTLLARIQDIMEHREGREPVIDRIYQTFAERYQDVAYADVIDELEDDLFEARDHACSEYYSTALFVLGRAAEKALYRIGKERNIRSIKVKYKSDRKPREKKWRKSRFSDMNEALKEAEAGPIEGKILNQKHYSEISKLISYRNDIAHKDHNNLDEERARVEINTAVKLLEDLSEIIEKLRSNENKFEETTQSYTK